MKRQSTTKGFAVLSAASMIVKVLSLLYLPFLQRIITLNGMGIYQASYQIFVWIYVLANSGIPVAISKLVSEQIALGNYRDAVKSFKIARFLMLISGVVFSLILFVFAANIAETTNYPQATLGIMALAPTLLFTSVVSSYRGYFQGRGNMAPTAISQVIEQAANTIFTLLFAALFMKYGIAAGVAGGTLGTSIGALIAAIYLIFVYEKNKTINVPKGFVDNSSASNKAIMKKIIAYGLPIIICVGLQYSGDIVDMAIVKDRLLHIGFSKDYANERYALLRYYRTILGVPIALISALQISVLPSLSGSFALKDKKQIEEKINYAFRVCFLVAVPAAVGLAVLGTPIFTLIANSPEGGSLLIFGSVVLILNSIVLIQTTILQSINKLYRTTIHIILGVAGKIIIDYIFVGIPEVNILGAVLGNFVMFLIPLVLNYRVIKRTLKIRVTLLKQIKKPFIATLFMAVIVFGTYTVLFNLSADLISPGLNNGFASLFAIGIGIIAYVYGLVLTKGISKEDIDAFPARFKKFIPKLLMKKIYEN